MIWNELRRLGLTPANCEIKRIREKFGISVFRITSGNGSYVGKHFNEKQNEIKTT